MAAPPQTESPRQTEGEPELAAEIDVACSACGSAAQRVLRSREELDHELETLRRFHRRRLVRRARAALQERASFTHDYPTSIVECVECGLVYRSPRPRASAVRNAYQDEKYDDERLAQLHESQLELFRPKARVLSRQLRRGARVLEVGSFVGSFLRAARELGLEAMGLDPNEQMERYSLERGLSVERETLEELAQHRPRMRWDAICIWNTFDQLPNPGLALDAAASLLVHGGVLVLRVPNGERYRAWATSVRRLGADARFPGLAWNNLIGFPYLHGYALPTLDLLLRCHGFERRSVVGDTLCTLADDDYAAWARSEESAWKASQRLRARVSPASAPWLDVGYQLVTKR